MPLTPESEELSKVVETTIELLRISQEATITALKLTFDNTLTNSVDRYLSLLNCLFSLYKLNNTHLVKRLKEIYPYIKTADKTLKTWVSKNVIPLLQDYHKKGHNRVKPFQKELEEFGISEENFRRVLNSYGGNVRKINARFP